MSPHSGKCAINRVVLQGHSIHSTWSSRSRETLSKAGKIDPMHGAIAAAVLATPLYGFGDKLDGCSRR